MKTQKYQELKEFIGQPGNSPQGTKSSVDVTEWYEGLYTATSRN